MTMRIRRALRLSVLGIGLLVGFSGPALAGNQVGVAQGGAAGLYSAEPAPLTPVQCGQCHPRHYHRLKEEGGRHRFDCQECHRVIHAFNPLKGNYGELMPRCTTCHQQPHGEKQTRCLSCHADPHAPVRAPEMTGVKDGCADCHAQPAKELKNFPSKHSLQPCARCHHDKHGYIPSCFECHKPHFANQPLASCAECHPVHQPKQVKFTSTTQAGICQGCHGGVYGKWSKTKSKHGEVNCTTCHLQHGQVPKCSDCHKPPHPEQQLKMFPRCLDCHMDVHDLPVNQ